MALIIPPGFGQAVYELALTGDSEQMVVTCGHDLSFWAGDFQSAVNRLHTDFGANIMPMLINDYSLTGVTLYVGSDPPPYAVYTSTNATVTGPGSAEGLPQNCALLIRKRTDLAGKRGRGRLYLPGIEEGLVTSAGVVSPAAVASFQTQVDAWYTDLTTTGGGFEPNPPVVLHRSEGIGAEPAPTPITVFVVDGVIATQRQRLRR